MKTKEDVTISGGQDIIEYNRTALDQLPSLIAITVTCSN